MTAPRRAESVQRVPIAVSAFSAAELEHCIRGLGGTESLATADPPVGTYVDEIYLSRQSANNLSLFDMERVAVLRGPQGTLFGRNTTGGAVGIVLALEAEDHYVRVHRSCWVRRDAVRKVSANGKGLLLRLSTGLDVPVSQAYKELARQAGLQRRD